MTAIHLYFYYLLLFLGLLALLYVPGKLVLMSARRILTANGSVFEDLFFSVLCGLVATTAVVAIWATRFRTIQLALVLPAVYLFRTLPEQPKGRLRLLPRARISDWIEILVCGVSLYSLFALGLFRQEDWSSILKMPHVRDWGVYSLNTVTMIQTGQENAYNVHNLLDSDYHGITPFHFIELWLAGAIRMFAPNQPAVYILGSVVYPALAWLAIMGTWAWLHNMGRSDLRSRWLCWLCLFSAGWFFLESWISLGPIAQTTRDLNRFLLFLPKRAIQFTIILASLLLWQKRLEFQAMIFLLILPIFSIDCLPAVGGGMAAYCLFSFRSQPRGNVLRLLFLSCAFAAIVGGMYLAWGNHKVPFYSVGEVLKLSLTVPGGPLIPLLFFVRGLIIAVVLYSFHWVGLYRILRLETNDSIRQPFRILLIMSLSGLAGWSILFPYVEGIQFFTGFHAAFQMAVLVLLVAYTGAGRSRLARGIVAVYVLTSAAYNFHAHYWPEREMREPLRYSAAFLDRVASLQPASRVGVCIRSTREFEPWDQRLIVLHSLGDLYLIYMPQYLKAVEIAIENLPATTFRTRARRIPGLNLEVNFDAIDAYRNRIMKESGIYYRFLQKPENSRLDPERAKVEFVDRYKLDWGIAARDAEIPGALRERITTLITDDNTGERFFLLELRQPGR